MSEQDKIPRDSKGRFPPGVSGNPGGGSKASRLVRDRIAERLNDVLASLFFLIDHGDTQAIKLALERVSPALKPETEAAAVDGLANAATLPDKAEAVIAAIGAGSLDADRGAKILAAILSAAQLSELEEIKRQIAELQARDLV